MTYRIMLTDRTTGETRHVETTPEWESDATDFLWTDGNQSCDCNRGQSFAMAAGEKDPNIPCGDGRFFLRVEKDDGEVVYNDAPPDDTCAQPAALMTARAFSDEVKLLVGTFLATRKDEVHHPMVWHSMFEGWSAPFIRGVIQVTPSEPDKPL